MNLSIFSLSSKAVTLYQTSIQAIHFHCNNSNMINSYLVLRTQLEICFDDPTSFQNCNEILWRELRGNSLMTAQLERLMVLIFYGATLAFGLVGNLLVIATVTLKPARSAQQPVDPAGKIFYPCLLCLATADLLLIAFCIPLRVFITYYQPI